MSGLGRALRDAAPQTKMQPSPQATENTYTRHRRSVLAPRYIKGYTVDRSQLAALLEVDISDRLSLGEAVSETIRYIDRDAYLFIGGGVRPGRGVFEIVIVLDEGDDEDELRGRELGPLDSSIVAAMCVLEGPSVWLREA
ncbi:hypothetical protein BD779DRAFT_1788651 [Infundibulicybe gibba]|nr:hypothetical protein BD779DRAFT_1788651 [Infundibulicybe gibba]